MVVRASDLLRADFPDYPNLRKPSKNVIVKGILKTIESHQSSFVLPSIIEISAKSYEKLKLSGSNQYCVDLVFRSQTDSFIGDGVMNGSHRIEALHQALLQGFNLDNVYVKLEISLGLTDTQIRETCLNLNKSKAPTRLSKNNYAGVFDWMKDLLPDDRYTISYFENHCPKGLDKSQTFCAANRIALLPFILDPKKFDGKDLNHQVRHPYRYAYPKENSFNPEKYVKDQDYQKLGQLLPDLITLQSYIGKCIEQSHGQPIYNEKGKIQFEGKLYPWVENPDIKNCTHFPDGTILNRKIPSMIFTVPIISCFRPWLNENFEWILPFDQFSEELAAKLWNKYKTFLMKPENFNSYAEALCKNYKLWDSLFKVSEDMIKQKFSELKVKSTKQLNNKSSKVA